MKKTWNVILENNDSGERLTSLSFSNYREALDVFDSFEVTGASETLWLTRGDGTAIYSRGVK